MVPKLRERRELTGHRHPESAGAQLSKFAIQRRAHNREPRDTSAVWVELLPRGEQAVGAHAFGNGIAVANGHLRTLRARTDRSVFVHRNPGDSQMRPGRSPASFRQVSSAEIQFELV